MSEKNDDFMSKVLQSVFLFINNSQSENCANLMMILAVVKIASEKRVSIFLQTNAPSIFAVMLNKFSIFSMSEYFSLFKKVIKFGDLNLEPEQLKQTLEVILKNFLSKQDNDVFLGQQLNLAHLLFSKLTKERLKDFQALIVHFLDSCIQISVSEKKSECGDKVMNLLDLMAGRGVFSKLLWQNLNEFYKTYEDSLHKIFLVVTKAIQFS